MARLASLQRPGASVRIVEAELLRRRPEPGGRDAEQTHTGGEVDVPEQRRGGADDGVGGVDRTGQRGGAGDRA